MKTKVLITLDEEILKKVDRHVEKVSGKRSTYINNVLKKELLKNNKRD